MEEICKMDYNNLTDYKLRISNEDFAILEKIAREEYGMESSRFDFKQKEEPIYREGNFSGRLIR
jgi:hypothetical protein